MNTDTKMSAARDREIDMKVPVDNRNSLHKVAALLARNVAFEMDFPHFITSLKLQATDEMDLQNLCGKASPTIYGALNVALNLWFERNGSEATFVKLLHILQDLNMMSTEEILRDYFRKTRQSDIPLSMSDVILCTEEMDKFSFDRKEISTLTGILINDSPINREFLRFVSALGLPTADECRIEREFERAYKSGPPFYDAVKKCLETWTGRRGSEATFEVLVQALRSNGLIGTAEDVQEYFDQCIYCPLLE